MVCLRAVSLCANKVDCVKNAMVMMSAALFMFDRLKNKKEVVVNFLV